VKHQTIVVLDFGSQFTQLIARRLRELSVYSEILPYNTPIADVHARRPVGIVLSGGPKSVSDAGAPRCERGVYDAGVPVLGICYGMQLMTDTLGGEVAPAPQREYGHAVIRIDEDAPILASVGPELKVWASHGDFVKRPPAGFTVTATSANTAGSHVGAPASATLFGPPDRMMPTGALARIFSAGVSGGQISE